MLNRKNTKKMNATLEKKLIQFMENVSCINENVELYVNDIKRINRYEIPIAIFISEEYYYYAIWFKTIRIKREIAKLFDREEILLTVFKKSLQ